MGARPSSFAFTSAGALRVYNTSELLNLPSPTWLIDNLIPQGGLASLYGAPESTKSFMAIDLALCVATGLPWHGRAVEKGFCIYVAAEGGPGIGKRVKAWLQHHNLPASKANVGWVIETLAVSSGSGDIDTLMGRIEEIDQAPKLIVIDTLARCFEGDENQQEDMGEFIAGMGQLRHEYGAAILAVHHTNLSGDRERGNTALRGGTDTMLAIERDKTTKEITLSCTKQKDAEHFDPMTFELQPVPEHESCVLVSTEQAKLEKTKQILGILATSGPLSWDDWLSSTGAPKTTFHRHFAELKKSGEIIKENGLWRVKNENEFHDKKWHK